jgi:tRNA(Ile)-lysidine synthase
MTGPPPATAACRLAVRRLLADVTGPVVAAVSGGADSLSLAAALAFERPGSGALVVDHALQPGSASVAARAAEQCTSLGLIARVLTAPPRRDWGRSLGEPDPNMPTDLPQSGGGREAAARELRYQLLDHAAASLDDAAGEAVALLGHTRDDQAETVLLGLVRGSGARALAGMAAVRGRYRRPFLDVPRAVVREACAEAGLTPHEDPHNDDPSFARVAVRKLLADLDITAGLARSAGLLREDADALDALVEPTDDVALLALLPPALRARAIKRWAEEGTGRALSAVHVQALRALVEDWHGQGPVALPGGRQVSRSGGRLAFTV